MALPRNVNRLTVAVEASIARTRGLPAIHRAPWETPWDWVGSLGGSAGSVRAIWTPEYRKLRASTRSAPGAVRTVTRVPPRVRPSTPASDRLPLSNALASTYSDRRTRVTIMAL